MNLANRQSSEAAGEEVSDNLLSQESFDGEDSFYTTPVAVFLDDATTISNSDAEVAEGGISNDVVDGTLPEDTSDIEKILNSEDGGVPSDAMCPENEFQIQRVCNLTEAHRSLGGVNVTLEDVYDILYKDFILNDLSELCDDRTWCLSTYTAQVLHQQTTAYLPLCDLTECLMDIEDECINEKRRFTMSSLMLLCNAERVGIDEQCVTAVKQMLHVTRARQLTYHSQEICDQTEQRNCSGSCQLAARQLHCMCVAACDTGRHRPVFQEFGPWQWVFTMQNTTYAKCEYSKYTCEDMNFQLNPFMRLMQKIIYGVQVTDKPFLAGVSAGAIIALIVSIAGLIVCWKKCRQADLRPREHIKYHEVTTEDMDYDSEA